MTPITGAQNLPVGLVTPGDPSVGTAAANVQYSIGSAQGTALQIAVVVGGNYLANDPTTDASITIAVPVAGGLICGGGTSDNSNTAGYASAGRFLPAFMLITFLSTQYKFRFRSVVCKLKITKRALYPNL